MIDPKQLKKWALSSTVAGVMFVSPLTGYASATDAPTKSAIQTDINKEQTSQRVLKTQATSSVQTGSKPSNTSTTILRVGSRGSAVSTLQRQLQALGYYSSKVDGIYGPLTANAVRQFQRDRKLTVDGIAGPQTFSALSQINSGNNTNPLPSGQKPSTNKSGQAKPAEPSQKTTNTLLKRGTRGTAVTNLQSQLKALGYFPHAVDGIFGVLTEQSVRNFQQAHRLAVDGIAGPATLAKLTALSKGIDVQPPPKQQPNPQPQPQPKTDKKEQPPNASFNVIQLVADASKLLGAPYVWGGTTPNGFDCSGFLVYVFNEQGVNLPRTVEMMWNYGKPVKTPSVGDVVFFETYKKGPSHAGIYVGDNKFIQSGTSTGVTVSDMNSSYWKQRYLGAKRLH